MSRQLDIKREERTEKKHKALIRALEFGLVGALESQGMELHGFTLRYDPFNVLITLRADIDGVRSVAHVGSDTIVNCILKAEMEAGRHTLRWNKCKYHQNND